MNTYRGGWYTKDDVLNDLAQVNGRLFDFDDSYIVKGERPPPPLACNEEIDEEIELRYGLESDKNCSKSYSGPDLQGITRLLREVSKHDDDDFNGENVSPEGNIEKPQDEVSIVTISKLNPHVKEFVPKSSTTNSSSNDDSSSTKSSMDKKIDISKLDKEEIKETVAVLKNKINETLKTNNMKSKREKNVAIAALIKLNSASPRSISPVKNDTIIKNEAVQNENEKPLKLFTPQYYEGTQACDNSNSDVKTAEVPTKSIPEVVEVSCLDQKIDDKTIQESINKVESWLKKPKSPKPKQPVLVLGPITYKKKEPRNSCNNSPSSEASGSSKPKVSTIGEYVPSPYVQDLYKKFEKQKKDKEERLDMWAKVQKEMKERDEILLKKREEELQKESEGNKSTDTQQSDEVHNSKDDNN